MKENQSLLGKTPLSFLSTLILFISIMIIQSCNNDKKEDGVRPAGVAGVKLVSGPFAVLKLDSLKLIELFADSATKKTKKLLIQFCDSDSIMLAIAYGSKKDNIKTNGPVALVNANAGSWDTTKTKILGNNELSYKQIYNLIGGKPETHAKHLYFYPKKNGDNEIYYVVSTILLVSTHGIGKLDYPPGEDTKPSPPAPPCDPCD